jgi:RNA polymerase sigma-70 factor, ECF subfamily
MTATVTLPGQRPAAEDDAAAAGWALVERAQAGDTSAFDPLYRRYHPVVRRFIYWRVRDEQIADDLTQDVFVRAIRGVGRLQWQGRDVGAWLNTVARNLVADYYKSARYQRQVLVGDMREFDRVDEDEPQAQVLFAAEIAEVRAVMAGLTKSQRRCLTLRYLDGLSIRETAAAMGLEEGAVKALAYRATHAVLARLDRARREDQ